MLFTVCSPSTLNKHINTNFINPLKKKENIQLIQEAILLRPSVKILLRRILLRSVKILRKIINSLNCIYFTHTITLLMKSLKYLFFTIILT